jgi:hypothetical protein
VELAQQQGHPLLTNMTMTSDNAIKTQQQRPGRRLPQLVPEHLTVIMHFSA